MKKFRTSNKGFTMIELMVVVLIVAVLAAIAIPIYGKYIKNARITEATSRMGEIITACKAFAQENVAADNTPQWPPQNGSWGVVGDPANPNFQTELFTYAFTAGQGGLATGPLEITATGRGKMANVTVVVNLPNINANALPPVVTIP